MATPGETKRFAKTLVLPDGWDTFRVHLMKGLLRDKFEIPSLREKLLATQDSYLEETNHWRDTFWGVYKGEGNNMLGKLFMEIRSEIMLP